MNPEILPVAPTNIPIPVPYASPIQRIAAHLIDILLLSVPAIILILVMGMSELSQVYVTICMGILSLIYFVYFESISGQTFGKQILHIKVVMIDQTPCTTQAAVKRNLGRIVDNLIQPYIIGLIAMFASKKKQRVGDLWAKTIVIKVSEHNLHI